MVKWSIVAIEKWRSGSQHLNYEAPGKVDYRSLSYILEALRLIYFPLDYRLSKFCRGLDLARFGAFLAPAKKTLVKFYQNVPWLCATKGCSRYD